ncbi:MAG: ferritin family protein [Planctomycetes bacterium]|nr:ferritin family protein [Planctomycetota bacterium]
MLPANLTPLEILDLAIHNESLTFQTYDRLGRRADVATLQAKLSLLKKDEKDHRKTLRAHRRSLFGTAAPAATEDDARRIFAAVDVGGVRDKESLVRAIQDAIKAEEYGSYFYDRMKDRIPDREARIFFEVLASEGKFHADILREQLSLVERARIAIDERGRPVGV